MRRLAILVLFGMIGGAAASANAAEDGVFTLYSNICLHQDSGDLLGTRLGLLRLADGTYAFYQESEGWPGQAQMVKLDDERLKKSQIDFQETNGGKSFHIQGVIESGAVVLTSGGLRDNDEKILRLKKVGLPEKVPDCR